MSRILRLALGCLLSLAVVVTLAPAASAKIEDYADYRPQTRCSPRAKPGTLELGHFMVRRFGGTFGYISRPCRSGGTSEHKEGRAFDWMLDAAKPRDRKIAAAFLADVFATDERGNEHAKARRMGIMYIIWKDHMWSAGDHFNRRDYLSSSCKKVTKCSKTLRHRNHLHVSLSWRAARAHTTWYERRAEAKD